MGAHGEPALRFQVLGPLSAWRGGSALDLGPVQQRLVLAVLLLHPNQAVGRQQLIDAVWGEESPTCAVNLLQRHASGLRRALHLSPAAGKRLTWVDGGYRLDLPPGCLDLEVFEAELRGARAARARGDPATAAEALRAAAARWRGPVCEGLSSPWLDGERDRWAERRLDLIEERIELDLAVGGRDDLIPELRRLVAAHPLRERLRGLLMRALHRCGRRADALEVYRQTRAVLREELGIEPDPGLRRLHQRILAGDPTLAAPRPAAPETAPPETAPPDPAAPDPSAPDPPEPRGAAPAATPEGGATVRALAPRRHGRAPAQLPHALADFVGREAEIEKLNALLPGDTPRHDATVVIATLAGTAGVGKTSLAVWWAHRVRSRFPDGQLYVNLRGYDPTGAALEPAKVIRGFLDALAVPPEQVPADLDEQAALYRSMLAERLVLIVLDDARDAAQVRPLLPGGPGCLVVVTSRDRLVGLVAVNGARPVSVDLLPVVEARELLARRLGAARVSADPEAVDEIIAACARLPLALSMVTARAETNPEFSLAELAEEIRQARGNLDVFGGGDPATDVRAVFAGSYAALSPPAARLFRLLALHEGPDVSARAAASLAAAPPVAARATLAELTRAHLVSERTPGRYVMHDLLRAYARELAERQDSPADRHAAVGRLLDHYLHTADAAGKLVLPYRDDPISLPPPVPGVEPERLADHHEAIGWLAAEEPVLLAALRQAAAGGFDRHTWQLTWALAHYLYRRGHWHEAANTARAALRAAGRLADPRGQATGHGCLAYAYVRLGRHDDALRHLRQAFQLYVELGDHTGMAHSLRSMAWALDRQQRYRAALPHVHRALRLFQGTGHRAGQARALNAIGWFHSRLGDHEEALVHCQRALDLQEEIGDRFDEADTLDSLGHAHYQLGRYAEAVACYRRAIDLYREFGDQYNEADTLVKLGDSQFASTAPDEARRSWERALDLLDQLGHPAADLLQARLRTQSAGQTVSWC